MKKIFKKLLTVVVKKFIKKSVNDVMNNQETPDVPEVEPITIPGDSAKKEKWKFFIQLLISFLTALAAALTTTSCVNHF